MKDPKYLAESDGVFDGIETGSPVDTLLVTEDPGRGGAAWTDGDPQPPAGFRVLRGASEGAI